MSLWIAQTLIATTLLMAAVLAVRSLITSKYGARVAYLLWLAPALRMALPPLPAAWLGVVEAPVQSVVVVLEGASSLSFQPTTAVGNGTAWPEIGPEIGPEVLPEVLMAIWLGGAALFFAWHMICYIRFSRRVMAGAEPLFDHHAIRIAVSAAISSPLAFGIFGKAVLVPADFEYRFSAVEQRLAIAHEVTHHVRRDLPVNLVALGMLALHWFNPIAHIAHRAFRLDQEASCDAIVLDGATLDERHAYGSALFKSATGAVPLGVCAMGTTTQLKTRLRRIVTGRTQQGRVRTGTVMASLLVLAGLVATASGGIAAETVATIEKTSAAGGGEVDTGPITIGLTEQPAKRTAKAGQGVTTSTDKPAKGAWADSEPAQAGAIRVKGDTARAQADALRQEADAVRVDAARADADSRRAVVMNAEPPEPPTPPAPPAVPLAPITTKLFVKVRCADNGPLQKIETRDHDIVICIKNVAVPASLHAALTGALRDIKIDLRDEHEPSIRAGLTKAIAAIQVQIHQIDAPNHRID